MFSGASHLEVRSWWHNSKLIRAVRLKIDRFKCSLHTDDGCRATYFDHALKPRRGSAARIQGSESPATPAARCPGRPTRWRSSESAAPECCTCRNFGEKRNRPPHRRAPVHQPRHCTTRRREVTAVASTLASGELAWLLLRRRANKGMTPIRHWQGNSFPRKVATTIGFKPACTPKETTSHACRAGESNLVRPELVCVRRSLLPLSIGDNRQVRRGLYVCILC